MKSSIIPIIIVILLSIVAVLLISIAQDGWCISNCECKTGIVTHIEGPNHIGGILLSNSAITAHFEDGSILITWLENQKDFVLGKNCTYCYHTALDDCYVVDSVTCPD